MKVDKEIATATRLISNIFKNVDIQDKPQRARDWYKVSVDLRTYCENMIAGLREYVDDERIEQFVIDFVDEMVHEYAQTGSLGASVRDFKEYLMDTVEQFANENFLELDVNSIVEGILNGVDVKQTVLHEGYRRVRLK